MFYLGEIVKDLVDDKLRLARNKGKLWKYGYDEQIDTVIISKDGTLGEIYNVGGLNIGLPQKPNDEDILNFDKTSFNQKWKRESLREGLNKKTFKQAKFQDFIADQYQKRDSGAWVYLNGKAVYITGTYWFFV